MTAHYFWEFAAYKRSGYHLLVCFPCFVVSRMQLTHIDAMKEITVKFHFDKKLCLRSTAMKLLVYSTSFLNLLT